MGAPDVSVTYDRPTTVLPGPHKGCAIANTGQNIVYLDHDASVSPLAYDFRLLPGQTVYWQADKPCYAKTDSPNLSTLSVSTSVSQFTSPPGVSGGAETNSDLIYFGKMDQLPTYVNGQPGLNVGAYQSLRIRTDSHGAFTNAGQPNISNYWGNRQYPASYLVNDLFWPSAAAQAMNEIVCDVKAPYFWPFNNPVSQYAAAAPIIDVEIIGYPQRRSPLAWDRFDPINQHEIYGDRLVQIYDPGIAIGAKTYLLPMWSGKFDLSVTMVTNVAATTLPTLTVKPATSAGSTLQGVSAPFVVLPLNTRDIRAQLTGISMGRSCVSVLISAGAGYTTADFSIQASYYGNEDS